MAAALVGFLAVAGVLSEASTSTQVGGAAADAAESLPAAETTSVTVDKSATAGKLKWTIHDASRMAEIRKFTIPSTTKRGDFVRVTFTVKNVSKTPVTLDARSLTLIDKTGFKDYPAAGVNSEYIVPSKAILFNDEGLLDPGEERNGEVNFDLAVPFGAHPSGLRLGDTGTSGFHLELGDAEPTAHHEKTVKLGF
ncbi:MAG TPA: DUF4352 domain-containing protein [Rubrobacteraceae bacterium]|nr:DUF4352 domain-containing protein [Rubrobacteraceae bacterium]